MRALALALVLIALPAFAQPGGRSVTGTVVDKRGNLLPGAVVQLENTVTLTIVSYIAQKDGRYFFKNLSPDVDFTLQATYHRRRSRKRTLSKFNQSKRAVVNLMVPVE